jgi:hypothetical protein
MGGDNHQESDLRRFERLAARSQIPLLPSRAGCIDRHETVFYVSLRAGNLPAGAGLFCFYSRAKHHLQ